MAPWGVRHAGGRGADRRGEDDPWVADCCLAPTLRSSTARWGLRSRPRRRGALRRGGPWRGTATLRRILSRSAKCAEETNTLLTAKEISMDDTGTDHALETEPLCVGASRAIRSSSVDDEGDPTIDHLAGADCEVLALSA